MKTIVKLDADKKPKTIFVPHKNGTEKSNRKDSTQLGVYVPAEVPQYESLSEAVTLHGSEEKFLSAINKTLAAIATRNGVNAGKSKGESATADVIAQAAIAAIRGTTTLIADGTSGSGLKAKEKRERFDAASNVAEEIKQYQARGEAPPAELLQKLLATMGV